MSTETIQIITYIRRHPSLTLAQFSHHWSTIHAAKVAPWAEKHGITTYSQIHTSGLIVPAFPSSDSAPNATGRDAAIPTTPQPYDGIAMFEVASLEGFRAAFRDPYYVEVVEMDERALIDKGGFKGGIVASFEGRLVRGVEGGRSVLTREMAGEMRRVFEEFEGREGGGL